MFVLMLLSSSSKLDHTCGVKIQKDESTKAKDKKSQVVAPTMQTDKSNTMSPYHTLYTALVPIHLLTPALAFPKFNIPIGIPRSLLDSAFWVL